MPDPTSSSSTATACWSTASRSRSRVLLEHDRRRRRQRSARTAYRALPRQEHGERSRASSSRDFGFAMTDTHLADMRAELLRRFAQRAEADPRHRRGAAPAGAATLRRLVRPAGAHPPLAWTDRAAGNARAAYVQCHHGGERQAGARPVSACGARRWASQPADCLVIEDSPAGIEAAHRRRHARLRLHRRLACRTGRLAASSSRRCARPSSSPTCGSCRSCLQAAPERSR